MDDGPWIDVSIPIGFAFITILCLGGWIWFWTVEGPPTRVQVVVTAIGLLIGLTYCIDRWQNWDVRAWQWHESTRNRSYTTRAYRLAMLGAPLGVLAAQIARGFVSQEVRYAFVSAGCAGMGLVCGWSVVESCRHLLYHRWAKR